MTWVLTIVFFAQGEPMQLEVGHILSEPICETTGLLLATHMAQLTGSPAGYRCEERPSA